MLLLQSIVLQLFTYAMECGSSSFLIESVVKQSIFMTCWLIERVVWEGDLIDWAFSCSSQDKCPTDNSSYHFKTSLPFTFCDC